MAKIPVILDTDIGGDIDDTWALVMLLGCPGLERQAHRRRHGNTSAEPVSSPGWSRSPIGRTYQWA